MAHPIDALVGGTEKFLTDLYAEAASKGLNLDQFQVDHICYRTSSERSYQSVNSMFRAFGKLLSEAPVNGRPIRTYWLNKPIQFHDKAIHMIEIPAPKEGSMYADGLEHIELITDPDQLTHPELVTSGHYKEWKLASGTIKFQDTSLLEVIQHERCEEISRALQGNWRKAIATHPKKTEFENIIAKTGVFELLAPYNPILAGTLPLHIDVPGSDFDILCQCGDFRVFRRTLQDHFSKYPDFKIKESESRGQPFIKASFIAEHKMFEIFAQEIHPRQQDAYKHMLVEGQLLGHTGEWAAAEIKIFKNHGMKTEPAFARFYRIAGEDPYAALLDLYSGPLQNIKDLAMCRLLEP